MLNEPIHEHYYRDTFIDAGIYNSEVETLADYFQRAEELRPDATLSINEFNIINSASDDATIEYRDLIQSLQDVGAPIDRIGIQAHIARNDITKNDIARRLNILAETGLPIEISEFDSRDDANQLNEEEQEQMFRDMLEATFENPAIDGFIMWGIWDIAHWRGNAPLYDINWNLKPEAAPWTELVLGEWMPNLSAQGVDSSGVWDSSGNLFRGTYQISASASGISAGITDFTLSADQELTITLELPSLSLAIAEDAVPENGGKSLVTLTRNTETVDPL
ncbi:MAG: endo-1,4-beta-xylanase, partial [Planctomycetota bacterium]